jgi:hypothetical protein
MTAHLSADREHIAEAVVRDEAGAGETALDDRVRGDGGAVREVVDVGRDRPRPLEQQAQAVDEPRLDPLGRRSHHGDAHAPVIGHDDGVGEGPSHVNSDPTHPCRDATNAPPRFQSAN